MECLLHISYRLDFKQWQARNNIHKEKLAIRKAEIRRQFREQMGLMIDQVQPGGAGTSNDGNTARRFFRNFNESAKITEINVELIKRFGVILQTLASGFEVDVTAFDVYCQETAELYIKEYAWFYMPASVHKILFHGSDIISNAMLPRGQLSEEAQEARNKDLKNYRRGHTRKHSREATNEDLLHSLLISSDPFITSLKPPPRKPINVFSADVMKLLVAPNIDVKPSQNALYEDITSTSEASSEEESDYESNY